MAKTIRAKLVFIIRAIIVCILALAVAVTIFAVLLYNNQEKIKKIVVSELNKNLRSEISVESIDFVFFKTFPFASIQFSNVLAKEVYNPTGNNDTLFYAELISFKLNALELYRGIYDIRRVDVLNGGFYMKYYADGIPNYNFWKSSDSTKSEFSFSLNKVSLQNVRYIYHNQVTRQHYDFLVQEATAKGNFSSNNQLIRLKGDILANSFQTDHLQLFKDVPINADVEVLNNSEQRQLQIKKGLLSLKKLPFEITGSCGYAPDSTTINMVANSQNISIEELIKLLPAQAQKFFTDYKSKGTLDIRTRVSGRVGTIYLPSVTADFNITNASLYSEKLPVTFKTINLKGSFTNGNKRTIESYKLIIDKFNTQINEGNIEGKLLIENFKNPSIDAAVSAKLNLADLHKFFKAEEVISVKGLLEADVAVKGTVEDLQHIQAYALNKLKMEGKASLKGVDLHLKSFPQKIRDFSADFNFNNQNVEIQNAQCKLGSSSIQLKGTAKQLLPFLFLKDEQVLSLTGSISADKLLLKEFLPDKSQPNNSATQQAKFVLPKRINASFDCNLGLFSYEKLTARNMKFKMNLKPQELQFPNLNLDVLGGNIQGSLGLKQEDNKDILKISGNVETQKININELFSTFNNFSQNTIKAENLQGNVSGSSLFSLNYSQTKGIDIKSMKMVCNVSVENGSLLNFAPLKKLSHFVQDESLQNVRFQKLENAFVIENEMFKMERLSVKSNALNFDIYGWQKFSGEIEYHLKINLSELASKKQKARLQKEQQEFGSFEEDNTGKIILYVIITGTIDNPIFKYDKKNATTKLKENLATEKENIKKTLKEEFSTKDEVNKREKENWKKQEAGGYVIEWEEAPKKDTLKPKTKPTPKFNIEWNE